LIHFYKRRSFYKMQTENKKLDYDEALEYIGQFGKFQRRIFFWLWLVSAAGGLAVVVFGFTAYNPKYRVGTECDLANSSYFIDEEGGQLPGWLVALNDQASNDDLKLKDHDCRIPTVTKDVDGNCISAYFTEDNAELAGSTYSELIIDRSVMKSSLVEEYTFFCDRAYLRSLYSAIYMLGMLVGSYLFGFLSDTFGRMKALMLATVCVSISGFLGAFCTGGGGAVWYAILRFITGMGGIGCFMVCFVLAVEHVGAKFTMLIGIAIEIPFAIGEALLGIEAMIFRQWQTLQIVAYLPLLALLGLWFVVPEPARWLLAKGRVAEAQESIRSSAATNGRKVPAWMLSSEKMQSGPAELAGRPVEKKTTVLDLFNTKLMAIRTVNMCFQWFSVTMCYYGLTNASTSLSADPFGNFMLSVLIEIPGYLFCILFMDIWGRRPILSFCQIVSGVSCVIVGLLSGTTDNTLGLQIFLSLLGKFCAAASFAIVYVYTAEMFPTSIRNQAVGVCSLVARIGGITSLLLDLLKVYWVPAPVFIMGCVATTAGALALFFPETLGERLPDTLEEAKRIGEKSGRSICQCTYSSPLTMYKEELKDAE